MAIASILTSPLAFAQNHSVAPLSLNFITPGSELLTGGWLQLNPNTIASFTLEDGGMSVGDLISVCEKINLNFTNGNVRVLDDCAKFDDHDKGITAYLNRVLAFAKKENLTLVIDPSVGRLDDISIRVLANSSLIFSHVTINICSQNLLGCAPNLVTAEGKTYLIDQTYAQQFIGHPERLTPGSNSVHQVIGRITSETGHFPNPTARFDVIKIFSLSEY
jgi:hypothetical protein